MNTPDVSTPARLARELHMSPKTLRAWLREQFARRPSEKWTRWRLTPAQISAARRRWATHYSTVRRRDIRELLDR
jgi:AraC-like DNA-binding protein